VFLEISWGRQKTAAQYRNLPEKKEKTRTVLRDVSGWRRYMGFCGCL